jgi:hypothetical protein
MKSEIARSGCKVIDVFLQPIQKENSFYNFMLNIKVPAGSDIQNLLEMADFCFWNAFLKEINSAGYKNINKETILQFWEESDNCKIA